MKRMEEFIVEQGLAVGLEDMEACVEAFLTEMRRGLAGEGSSLEMLPTYIQLDDQPDYSRSVIVVDAGGTNLRVALVGFSSEGIAEIRSFQRYPMLGTQGEISAEEFYSRLADCLADVAGEADCIGICFSFPAEILPSRDARILCFNKEVRVTGAEGTVIGERLRAAMKAKGLPHEKSVVVINDTVASLLGARADNVAGTAYGSYVGFILGTGLNSCYIEENCNIKKNELLRGKPGGTVINMEAGGFSGITLTAVDKAFVAETINPEGQLMEKLSSGAYQADLLHAWLRAARREGCFSQRFGERLDRLESFTGLDMDLFCDHPYGDGLLAGLAESEEDTVALYRLMDAFFNRVGMLAAVTLSSVLLSLGDRAKNPCRPVCISAEGTTFYKARLLRPHLDYYMSAFASRRLGICHRFVRVENATISGSAVAGLLGNA